MPEMSFGRYEILHELGRGGMAVVYHARDPRFNRDVALKVLPREFLFEPTFRARFEREAQTIASLEHSTIVPVYDFGESEGQPFLVMRFMPGGSLDDRIAQGAMPLDEVIHVLERIATALDTAHRVGIVHRDIKPANILFDQYGDAYLSDFGIVKLTESTAQLTGSGIVGTPAYMAPEMMYAGNITGLIDIYALGVTLYQMITGRQPFDADTPMGVLMAHGMQPVPDITQFRDDLPDGMQAVVDGAMAKDPKQRHQSAGQIVKDLKAVLVNRYETAPTEQVAAPSPRPIPQTRHTEEATVEVPLKAAEPTVRHRPRRRFGWLYAVIPLAVVALVMGGLWLGGVFDGGTAEIENTPVADVPENTEPASSPTPGNPIFVPGCREVTHIIGEGESLLSIALTYGVNDFEALQAYLLEQDSTFDMNQLYVGQELTFSTCPEAEQPQYTNLGTEDNPVRISIPTLPDTEVTGQEMLAYNLSRRTGVVVEVQIYDHTNPEEVLAPLCNGEIHGAVLDPFTYIMANWEGCAEAHLGMIRFGNSSWRGEFITFNWSGLDDITDLENAVICRPGQDSLSGWVLPGLTLMDSGINHGTIQVVDSGSHTNAIIDLASGLCNVATVYDDARVEMEEILSQDVLDALVVIGYTPDVPYGTLAWEANMHEEITGWIDYYFAEMSYFYETYGWEGFKEIDPSWFAGLDSLLTDANVRPEDAITGNLPGFPGYVER